MHVCEICYNTFKTKQHLNQHVSKKKKCQPHLENNTYLGDNKDFSFMKSDSEPLTTDSPTISESTAATIDTTKYNDETDNTKDNDETDNIYSNGSYTSGNNTFQKLSVINILEFVNTHKKMLEEKNKLESTLIILKKQLDKLTKENFALKNKINVVNNFVVEYKNKDLLLSKDINSPVNTL